MAINRRTLRVERELQAFLADILDTQTRAIVEAWVTAFDTVAAELDAAALELVTGAQSGRVTRTMVQRSRRAQTALDSMAAALDQATRTTGAIITADLWAVIDQAVWSEAGMIETQLTGTRRAELAANLVRADSGQIAAMVQRATEQITALTLPLAPETYATVRTELLRGISVGANPRTTARRMVARVEDRTNFGLTRALVVSRTETLDATRRAAQAVDQANTDVVKGWQWVAELSTRTCPACFSMHGREFPTSEPGPLGHQQCLLPGAVVAGPRALASTTRWFDGEVVELQLRRGNFLAVTPNHPILTPHGWVAAGELREGDDVVTGSGANRPAVGRGPDDYQVPALVEDVAQTLGSAFAVDAVSVPTAPEDFHGDGAGSDVHVVRTDRLLWDHLGATSAQVGREGEFMVGDVGLQSFTGGRDLATMLRRVRDASRGRLRGLHDLSVLLGGPRRSHGPVDLDLATDGHPCGRDAILDPSSGASVGFREGVDRLASHVAGDDLLGGESALGQQPGTGVGGTQGLLGGTVAPQVTFAEDRPQSSLAYPMPTSDDLAAFAGRVVTDSILDVRRRSWSGHVYNLQTETGWYLANGILTHNCRCTRVPHTKTWTELGFQGITDPPSTTPDAAAYFDRLTASQQKAILGPKRYDAWQAGEYPMSQWATRRTNDRWRDSYVIAPAPRTA